MPHHTKEHRKLKRKVGGKVTLKGGKVPNKVKLKRKVGAKAPLKRKVGKTVKLKRKSF